MHGRVCFCSICVPHNSTASPGSVHSIYATFDSSNDARQHADVLVATAIQWLVKKWSRMSSSYLIFCVSPMGSVLGIVLEKACQEMKEFRKITMHLVEILYCQDGRIQEDSYASCWNLIYQYTYHLKRKGNTTQLFQCAGSTPHFDGLYVKCWIESLIKNVQFYIIRNTEPGTNKDW
jgi:hypothetical protein